MVPVRKKGQSGRRQPKNKDQQDELEQGKTIYYPDLDAEPRLDQEWASYATTVERTGKDGEEQTFVVSETPFSKLPGFPMVST